MSTNKEHCARPFRTGEWPAFSHGGKCDMPDDIWDRDNPDGIWARLVELEAELGLPQSFCEKIADEDDWSLIIKLHALFEAALSSALTLNLDRPQLRDQITRMGMNAKLSFASALELVGPDEKRFLAYLSKRRNDLVHNIGNVSFTLADWLRAGDDNRRQE